MATPAPRRVLTLVLAVVVAAVCVRLGIWQLHRLQERRSINAAIVAGLARPEAPAAQILAGTPGDAAYRPVVATGTYLPEHELIAYGRPLQGAPGDHVLTPLRLPDGDVLLVDRGWIPFEAERDIPVRGAAAAPAGTVTVEGVLLPSEQGDPFPEGASGDTVVVVAIPALAAATGLPLVPEFLSLQHQSPASVGGLPAPAPLPQLDEGPHLSYAIQWFSFAAIALIGYGLLVRRDRAAEARSSDTEEAPT